MAHIVSRRPSLRIRLDAYSDLHEVCFVTIPVRLRMPIFRDDSIARAAVEVLHDQAARTDVRVWAFCVMPDHVHLVVSPSERCDIIAFVGRFKSLVLRRAWSLGVEGTFWQPSFWDHFLRQNESKEHGVRYVLENPVRAGLVTRWSDYPYLGWIHSRDEGRGGTWGGGLSAASPRARSHSHPRCGDDGTWGGGLSAASPRAR
jgi:REP element-mobilizing transposase RayT